MFLLRPDNILPLIVRVPVSSKMLFLKYTTRLISSLMPITGVVTKITLERTTSNAGQAYSRYIFEAANVLSTEEAATAKAFSHGFMEIMNSAYETDEGVVAQTV